MASKRDLTIKRRRHTADEPDELPMPERRAENVPDTRKNAAKPRRRRRQRSLIRVVFWRLVLVAVVITAGVLIWRNWDHLAPAAVSEWVNNAVTGGEGGDGFPVAITGSNVVSMQSMGSQVAVLTDTSLLMYNERGGEIVSRGHTYADPLLDTSGSYALVAELGGTRYMLGTKKEALRSDRVSNAILGAAVDSNGSVALATESSRSYMSEVVVFDRTGAETFHWYSVDLTVVDVALSPNGKRVAVLGLSAENGEMKSTLLIFRLAGSQTTAEYTYSASGAMMAAVHYYGNGRVAAVGDTAAWVYDPDSNSASTIAYDNEVLLGYSFSDRGVGVVTRGFGESGTGTLHIMTPAGKETAALEFTGDFRHLSAADNGFYLLTANALYNADTATFARQTSVAPDGLQTVSLNGRPLLLSLTALSICSLD